MTDQNESGAQRDPESEFARSTRRTFIARLGLAGVVASAGSATAVFAENPEKKAVTSTESKDAVPVKLKVNGKQYDLRIDPRTSLLDCLREHLHLTGSKKGCDHGQCGAGC